VSSPTLTPADRNLRGVEGGRRFESVRGLCKTAARGAFSFRPSGRRGSSRLCEPSDEAKCRVGDLAPTVIDREGVSASLDLDDLGHSLVAVLVFVRRVSDRPGDGVVLLPGDDQQRSAVGVLRIDPRFTPGVQVRCCGLEDRFAGAGDCVGLVEFLRLVLAYRVREAVPELLKGEGNGAVSVRRVGEHR
jgi:hypothetical protein